MANPSRRGPSHDRCLSSSSPSQHVYSGSSSPASLTSPNHREQQQSPPPWQFPYPQQYHSHQTQYHRRRPVGPTSPPPPPLSARSSSSSLQWAPPAEPHHYQSHLDSCEVCFEDNVKCDRRRPQCNRCVSLRFACHYSQRPRSIHRSHSSSMQRPPQNHHAQPVTTSLDETALLADINHDLHTSLEHAGLIRHDSASGLRHSHIDDVAGLMGGALHARNEDPHSIRWPALLQSAEAVVENAKHHRSQTDILAQYACPPEIIESWNHLQRVCSSDDPCEEKIQKVMPRLSHMYVGVDGELKDNNTIYRENREAKSWFLEEMKVIMMCSCSNRAKVACRIIIACLSLLAVYHVNIMGLNGRHPTSTTSHPAPGPSSPSIGSTSSQRRALAFSTIVLPPLPSQGTSRGNSLSTYAALNQHLDAMPDMTLPPTNRPPTNRPLSPEGGGMPFPPLSRSCIGSPPLPPPSDQPRTHNRFDTPARKMSDGSHSLHYSTPNPAFTNYEVSQRHVVGDVRLLAELFESIRFINQVITRYEGTSSHIEIPGHRTGYDKAGLEAATRGMSVELKDKLIQVLQAVACLRYPT
ncbi:hypothetical protein BROUX41_002925 [Berkeleyomyces rouxiae]|uniref:uncharacterized protein n=1 Tax=Berkeleyomyces rouxiae TaxID=2035830 RepID=UPI003B80B137